MSICLVTGAGRGSGAAIAHRLSADGHKVALCARSREELEKVAAGLAGPALVVPGDVTEQSDLEEVFATVEREWGPVEVLVANAGTGTAASLVETTDDDWQRMLELNLTAVFRSMRRALPSMLENHWGRIVVIASVAAKHGEPMVSAYTASKHGVLGLVRSAAAEVAKQGVTVNAVCPGYVDSPMTQTSVQLISERTGRTPDAAQRALAGKQPIGRLIAADEVAQTVAMCVQNAAINGQGINVDGGAVQS